MGVSVLKGSCRFLFLACGEIGTGLVEGFENGIGAFVVIVNDVDKEGGVHQVVDELASWGVRFVVLCPLVPQLVCFVLS